MHLSGSVGVVVCLISAVLASGGCGSSVSDDGAMEEETSGDGDGDPGDGDGDPGDGDGDPGGLDPICTDGCTHVQDCAPDQFAALYADIPECVAVCIDLWGACMTEGSTYIYCTLGLDCAGVMTLLTEGPAQTECGSSYDAAQAACMNP